MKMINKISLYIIIAVLITGCKKNDDSTATTTPTTTPTAMSSRDSVVQDYNTNYLGSNISTAGWTGSAASCSAGAVAQATNNAVINRINYYRRLVGLNDNCTLDASLFPQEQQTALMMKANNALNHYPPSSWSCYTANGATGAHGSDLAFGAIGSTAITAFIQDDGTGNEPVGHRRWIMRSDATTFSCGSTDITMALYVFGAGGNTQIPAYIAYPPKGYIPQQLVPNRWSFGIPNADFSSATVTMTGPNGNVPLTVTSKNDNGYADNTIVWVPTGINTTSASDVTYTVTISSVANSSQSSYIYSATIIKP
jgi:hypothetical protein